MSSNIHSNLETTTPFNNKKPTWFRPVCANYHKERRNCLLSSKVLCYFLIIVSFLIVHQWKEMIFHISKSPQYLQPLPESRHSPYCNCGKNAKIIKTVAEDVLMGHKGFHWCSPESTIRGRHQRVISYALYGEAENRSIFHRYYQLIGNISLSAESFYPGWVVRIYHNITIDSGGYQGAHDFLCAHYCNSTNLELCSIPKLVKSIGNSTSIIDPSLLRGLNPRMFRFMVMLDPDVDVFISRDIDSVIIQREVDAVNQWLQSNYTFHIMRDHPSHASLVLAGMFGVKLGQRRDLMEGTARLMIESGQNEVRNQDQISLGQIFWTVAKYDVMAHDSYHCINHKLMKASPLKPFYFPTQRQEKTFVGAVFNRVRIPCPNACRPPHHQQWNFC